VVSFTPRMLYPQGKSPPYPLDRWLGGAQTPNFWSENLKERDNLGDLDVEEKIILEWTLQ